jgi:putative peptide zinc metalloprotease protein
MTRLTRPGDRTEVGSTRGGRTAAPRSTPPPSSDGADPGSDGSAQIRVPEPPAPAPGVDLLGEFEGSAFKEPPRMARRPDGQIVQLPPMLYLIAERLDGKSAYEQLAADLTPVLERQLEPDDVRFLVEEKLAPLGIVAVDGEQPSAKADPLLALRLRTALVPPRAVNAATAIFRPLFLPPVLLLVLGAFIAFDVWLFSIHGVAQSVRSSIYQPTTLLMLFGFVVFAAAFHEFGHATGSRYGGAPPGAMGFGIYIVWPAFYTDISESHRLGRGGRLRADLGGVYFHAIFILVLGAAYLSWGFEPLLLVAVILQVEVVRQMLPLLRFDGYYVLSDLVGIPDLFLRLKPILLSLIPWRKPDPKVTELKPWARIVVSLWVLLVVVTLGFYLSMMAIAAPRIFATAWDSFRTHLATTRDAWSAGETARGALSAIQVVALSLPALGITYTATLMVRRLGRAWSRLRGRPLARSSLAGVTACVLGVLTFLWWPDADYRPVQAGETWTVQQYVSAIAQTARGEPATALSAGEESVSPGGMGPIVGDETETDPPPSPGPSPSPSPSASVSPTPSPSPSPSTSPSTSPSPSPSVSPSPSPSTSPSPSPSP